ncbi:MAG: NusG domain II-containing protein [Fibrobacteria bacterium]|nr:NusG domain II-containing protein [Fibrobacteria bacterium]
MRPPPHLFRPLDAILLLGLLGAGAQGTWSLFTAPEGARATVWIDGRRASWFPLDGPERIDTVRGSLGPVVVRHGSGETRILSAPCPGKICVHQGSARRTGAKLVCVPSRVVVSIEGSENDPEALDAVQ